MAPPPTQSHKLETWKSSLIFLFRSPPHPVCQEVCQFYHQSISWLHWLLPQPPSSKQPSTPIDIFATLNWCPCFHSRSHNCLIMSARFKEKKYKSDYITPCLKPFHDFSLHLEDNPSSLLHLLCVLQFFIIFHFSPRSLWSSHRNMSGSSFPPSLYLHCSTPLEWSHLQFGHGCLVLILQVSV